MLQPLLFGILSAPVILRVMECLLREIPGVAIYLDDILITASSNAGHLITLDRGFQYFNESKLSKLLYFM